MTTCYDYWRRQHQDEVVGSPEPEDYNCCLSCVRKDTDCSMPCKRSDFNVLTRQCEVCLVMVPCPIHVRA